MNPHIDYEIVQDRIAVIHLDTRDSKVNVLGKEVLESLEKTLGTVSSDKRVKACIFRSAKEKGFVAGANIEELKRLSSAREATAASRKGQLLFNKIADMPFPTIAAINGHCMGGGTELALACDFRLAAKQKADIALPEIKLGIFPGWGGSQRLPRLISLQRALDMILTGKGYNAKKAHRCGLVDRVVPDDILDEYCLEFAREVIRTGGAKYLAVRKRKARGILELLTDKNFIGRFIVFTIAKRNVQKRTGGNYPAPFLAIEAMMKGLLKPLEQGLEIEARLFGQAVDTREHKNLVHVYDLRERPKKQTGVGEISEFPEIGSMGVLGAGVMGGGIVQLLAYKDYPVRMKDIKPEMLSDGLAHAKSLFKDAVKSHKLDRREMKRKMELIHPTVDYDGFSSVDAVIEAVAENMEIKKQVLKEIEEHLSENAVFASNTSALSISEMQSAARHPERVCGMHFFNPVHKMPLVEVTRGEKTDDKTVAAIFDLAKKLNKTPIVVKDSPGFLVNRLLSIYLNEACILADEGYDFPWIDQQIKKFGMPMGPFRLIDEVGIDIAEEVAKNLGQAFQERIETSSVLTWARQAGLAGKKKGKGFYVYNGKKRVNRQVRRFLPGTMKTDSDEVVNRMMYQMVNEAARCLEEKVVASPADVDTGMIFGTGFPPFRGGLCRWADTVGLGTITETLNKFGEKFGKRFFPCQYLVNREVFYDEN